MNTYIRNIVVIALLVGISGCANIPSIYKTIESPTTAPQPQGTIHTIPTDPGASALESDLAHCRNTYGQAVSEQQIELYELCLDIAFDKNKTISKGTQVVVKNDLGYRKQTDKELNSEMKRREKAQKANAKERSAIIKDAEKAYKVVEKVLDRF